MEVERSKAVDWVAPWRVGMDSRGVNDLTVTITL